MNGKLQIETISSIVLKENPLGDPRRREIPVYLPPSYGTKRGRRFPVLYFLVGYTGTGRGVINYNPWKENLVERFDRLIEEGKAREAILVIPDCFTAYGGSQYLNSTATGRYEDHLVHEVVGFIDDKFPTMRSFDGRALFGHSSGGFGALTLGMRHPDVFGHVYSHSGDSAFEANFPPELLKLCVALEKHGGGLERYVADFRARRTKTGFDSMPMMAIAMAACFSPNPKSPLGFDLPVDLRTGALIPSVWKRWEALDPIHACAKQAGSLARLKTLCFDAGVRDEYFLHFGARRLSDALKRLKVKHSYEEHEFGHSDMHPRYDVSLSLLSKRCARVN